MPTFPGHWAACSGSIEEGETPAQAALREIQEETNALDDDSDGSDNLRQLPSSELSYGLYVDVPFPSRNPDNQHEKGKIDDDVDAPTSKRIIRVYPFLVELPHEAIARLQMRGTEHDAFQWVSVSELERLDPAVPGLARAFHRASRGAYLLTSNQAADCPATRAREWASDRESGANAMARNALRILSQFEHPRQRDEMRHFADCMLMMRPSMVAITNALMRFKTLVSTSVDAMSDGEHPAATVSKELERETDQAVQRAVEVLRSTIKPRCRDPSDSTHVVVFSRSSTLVSILQQLGAAEESKLVVTCSRSTPGDEGAIMAQDLTNEKIQAHVVDDAELLDPSWWLEHRVDAVLVGSDCILAQAVVYNKVGTKALAEAANQAGAPVVCCGDAFKAWDDSFPPPVEDIFEPVPRGLLQHVVY
jgi:ribose 1,5-bisphosphate isomerase